VGKNVVVLVRQEGLGQVPSEDRAFGIEAFDIFCHTLETEPEKPTALCFYTDGVKLLAEGSLLLPALALLQGMGIRLVACGTCVDHFGLTDRLALGDRGTMKEILGLMLGADSVITI
jgi:hypothetical protein